MSEKSEVREIAVVLCIIFKTGTLELHLKLFFIRNNVIVKTGLVYLTNLRLSAALKLNQFINVLTKWLNLLFLHLML